MSPLRRYTQLLHGDNLDRKETPMVDVKPKQDPKVENPATHFDKPQDVVQDKTLSMEEKRKRLALGSRMPDKY